MTENKSKLGNILALITVTIWGTTFVATKTLLENFSSIEIAMYRFSIAFVVLFLLHPKTLKFSGLKQELLFILAGLFGVALYFIFEILALSYSTASNVAIVVSVSPLFIAIFSQLFLKEKSINKQVIIGFVFSLIGIILLSTKGDFRFRLNLVGDLLALLSAMSWAVYSIIMKKISELNHNPVAVAHRTFFYGLLFMLPIAMFSGFSIDISKLKQLPNIANILYLGVGGSAIGFLFWGICIKTLGQVKASSFIYLIPLISTITAAVILKESITIFSVIGTVLVMLGVMISERKSKPKAIDALKQ